MVLQFNISAALKTAAAIGAGQLQGEAEAEQLNQQRTAIEYQRASQSAQADQEQENERFRTAMTGLQYADETARPGLFEQISRQYSSAPGFDERVYGRLSGGAQRRVYPQGSPRFLPRGGQASDPGGGQAPTAGTTAPPLPAAPVPANAQLSTPPALTASPATMGMGSALLQAFNQPDAPQPPAGQARPTVASGTGGASPPPPGQGAPNLGAAATGAAAIAVNRPNPNLPIGPQVAANRSRLADEGSDEGRVTSDESRQRPPAPGTTLQPPDLRLPLQKPAAPVQVGTGTPPPDSSLVPRPSSLPTQEGSAEPTYTDAYTGQVVKASPAGGKLQADITYAEHQVDKAREFVQNYPPGDPNARAVSGLWQQIAALGPLNTRAKIEHAVALTGELAQYEPGHSIEQQRLQSETSKQEKKEDPRVVNAQRAADREVTRLSTLIDGSVLPPEDGRWQHAAAFRKAIGDAEAKAADGTIDATQELTAINAALAEFRPYERAFGPGARRLAERKDKKAQMAEAQRQRQFNADNARDDRLSKEQIAERDRRAGLIARYVSLDPATEAGRRGMKILAPMIGQPVPTDAQLISIKQHGETPEAKAAKEEIGRLAQKKAQLAEQLKTMNTDESVLANPTRIAAVLGIKDSPRAARYRKAVPIYNELVNTRTLYLDRLNSRLKALGSTGATPGAGATTTSGPLTPAQMQAMSTDKLFQRLQEKERQRQQAAGAH